MFRTINSQLSPRARSTLSHQVPDSRKSAVLSMLRAAGAHQYDLILPESRSLPNVLYADEQIKGIVYGRYELSKDASIKNVVANRGAIAITDQRLILLDRKPLYFNFDYFDFGAISGVSYVAAGIWKAVMLNTRMGDITIRTLNQACASRFVEAVETMLIGRQASVK